MMEQITKNNHFVDWNLNMGTCDYGGLLSTPPHCPTWTGLRFRQRMNIKFFTGSRVICKERDTSAVPVWGSVSWCLQIWQNELNLQFLTLYYTRTGYISAMIVDLQHSQNNGSTNSETNYQQSDASLAFSLYCKTHFEGIIFHFSLHLSSIIKPDLSIVCVSCTQHIPYLSEIKTHTLKKNTQYFQTESARCQFCSHAYTYESWKETKMHMYNHRINDMTELVRWHFGWSYEKMYQQNQTKQWLYTFATYSQEPERSSSEPREHISCSLCGSVWQKYKKMAVTTTDQVFPISVIITTVIIINNNNINIIKYWNLPG